MTDIVRTVRGDISPSELGKTYCHEHLIIDSKMIAVEFPHIHLHSVSSAVDELIDCKQEGLSALIDAMPCSAGRQVEKLAEISSMTDMHIVVATGLHHDRYYGNLHWSNRVSVDVLTELFIADVTVGIDRFDYTSPVIDRTNSKAGVIKVATSGSNPDTRDLRNLEAVANAHVATGAPIITHCEGGEGALEQVAVLNKHGVQSRSIMLSHVDKNKKSESPHHRQHLIDIAQTGVFLEFDQALRQGLTGELDSVRLIAELFSEGFGEQVVVGTDGARRSLWRSLGGEPGLGWLIASAPQLLINQGLSISDISRIYVENPRAVLSFDPRLPSQEMIVS